MNIAQHKASMAWLLSAPALILMFLILFLPILVATFFSFTSYSLGSDVIEFVGFENYEENPYQT